MHPGISLVTAHWGSSPFNSHFRTQRRPGNSRNKNFYLICALPVANESIAKVAKMLSVIIGTLPVTKAFFAHCANCYILRLLCTGLTCTLVAVEARHITLFYTAAANLSFAFGAGGHLSDSGRTRFAPSTLTLATGRAETLPATSAPAFQASGCVLAPLAFRKFIQNTPPARNGALATAHATRNVFLAPVANKSVA